MNKTITCIMCPNGCEISVDYDEKEKKILSVDGNTCPKGEEYAANEILHPMRVLTATMKTKGSEKPFAVKTDGQIPKELMLKAAEELRNYHPDSVPAIGDVVIENLLGTGVNVIKTN